MDLSTNERKAYLKSKLDEFLQIFIEERIPVLKKLYENFQRYFNELTLLSHYNLNDLFKFMNEKKSKGLDGHYNPKESRNLIFIINEIKTMQTGLKN